MDQALVVGITGSVGKTTVKDLLASILSQQLITAASVRSFNNELGVPLTLVNSPDGVEAVVVEMGARGVGHIAELCSIASPKVGLVTRVASVHTELFGTLDDVAVAKGELIEALPADGTAVLNAEDERVTAMAGRFTGKQVIRYGAGGDVTAADVTFDDELRGRFTLQSPWGDAAVRLAVRGLHQVSNALAASAAALACGLSAEVIAEGLAAASLSPWRMDLVRLRSGARIVNDAYNANPTSVTAALDALLALPAERRTAVLGVMAELGPSADDEHAAIGFRARAAGIRLIAVDAPAYGGEQAAGIDEAVALLGPLDERDVVLVKGSRVAGLERVVSALERLEG
jgi:UDP-N-acetylmuramoyl-tripeptide--D-alanyl-D-alanine ligase